MTAVLRLPDLGKAAVARIGGKARGLVRLAEAGCRVPAFFVIPTDAFAEGHGSELPAAWRASLREAVSSLGDTRLAVRSSATVEDAAVASWAGQFDTILGARGPDEVEAAVLRCWASVRGERAGAYAALHGPIGEMAVIVQVMVEGAASGVLFSRDPDDPDRVLISAGLGLGEGVVQGIVPCDTWRVDAQGQIDALIEPKDEEIVLGPQGPESRPVADARRDAPALTDEQIREVVRWGRTLEAALGAPVDVEFTVANGAPVLLQVRPIAAPVPLGRRLLWDNSNIVESYSGITTPLTFSFASRAYTIVYQLFCRVMGVDDATIQANEPVFRRMIGLMRGRIYYNLNAWYRVLALLPGFSFNRGAMETMMGVSEVASDEDAGAEGPRWLEGARLARLGARLGWRLFRLDDEAAAFQEHFRATLARVRSLDLDRLRPDELLAVYEDVERELLWSWTPPLVNDFFCMIFYRMLQKRCQAISGDPATTLHNRLLAGEGTLASAAPATALADLADLARGDAPLAALLTSDQADRDVLSAALAHGAFGAGFRDWMAAYGDRSPDELKLEAPSLADTPEFVLGAVRASLRQPRREAPEEGKARLAVAPASELSGSERASDELSGAVGVRSDTGSEGGKPRASRQLERRDAEIEADRLVTGTIARWSFGWILGQTRRRVATRESLRFERTRIFGFVRRLFRAFGDRFAAAGALDRRDDIVWLTVDEVLGFVRGTTATTDLRGLVEVRRREFDGWRAAEAPAERFHTWGAVHLKNRFRGRPRPPVPTGDTLVGTACSPGIVIAPARVVHDPREVPDLGGALLVAHRTDPGWIPLYPTASAILVERGSLLSHSAVVARELGLPAIVGVRGLLEWVRDGETLEIDGSTGVIRRVPAKEAVGG